MRQQTAEEFERANSRRMWRTVGFVLVLLLAVIMAASYLFTLIATGGGRDLIGRAQQAGTCVQQRLMPLSAAIERCHRDKGTYPERVEDVYPVYLKYRATLRCPADPEPHPPGSSFIYRRPDPARPGLPLMECLHHRPILLQVVPRGKPEDGVQDWEVRIRQQPEPQQGPAPPGPSRDAGASSPNGGPP